MVPGSRKSNVARLLRERSLAAERLHRHAEPSLCDRAPESLGKIWRNDFCLCPRIDHRANLMRV